MKCIFYKYQGTGNDFVIIDNREDQFDKNDSKRIAHLCDRRFGIGADGLILLEEHYSCDFRMVYFNADGHESSMCGNGGRCITHFAHFLGIIKDKATFEAIDGLHHSVIDGDVIKLQMQNVTEINKKNGAVILDTGSPHYVTLTSNVSEIDVSKEGARIRYGELFREKGININFVEKINNDEFLVRTYERGVEGETLSCGTGVTAIALAMHHIGETENDLVSLQTKGGILKVNFKPEQGDYLDIWLIGPAIQVYKGEISW